MPKAEDQCVSPAKGPIAPTVDETPSEAPDKSQPGKGIKMQARVGKPAPDFEASGYFEGGFKNFKLSDYKGKWVVLCFYPGDFTFV